MTDREKLARDIYLVMLPKMEAPSLELVDKYLSITAQICVNAADALIKELDK